MLSWSGSLAGARLRYAHGDGSLSTHAEIQLVYLIVFEENWLYELRSHLRGNEGLLAPPQFLQPPRPRAMTEVS